MTDIAFTIERTGYPTIDLSDGEAYAPYTFLADSRGLGMGPIISRTREGAADGVQYDGDKVGAGAIDLALKIQGEGRIEVGERVRALRRTLRWRQDQPNARLVASFANGDILDVPVVYSSGLEQSGEEMYDSHYFPVVALTCPLPFWTARTALQFTAGGDSPVAPFLSNFAGLPVAPSTVLGTFTAVNPGDVESDLTVIVRGPSDGLITVTVNGRGWTFSAPLSTTETITATRTAQGVKVTDQAGANRYRHLGPAPKFPRLAPGDNTISVSMVGATAESKISGFWRPRYEGIY